MLAPLGFLIVKTLTNVLLPLHHFTDLSNVCRMLFTGWSIGHYLQQTLLNLFSHQYSHYYSLRCTVKNRTQHFV